MEVVDDVVENIGRHVPFLDFCGSSRSPSAFFHRFPLGALRGHPRASQTKGQNKGIRMRQDMDIKMKEYREANMS